MYDLARHRETDSAILAEFICEHPFALITAGDANGMPVATQLPVFHQEREGRQFLSGHLMKDTDHYHAFKGNTNVLAVFSSPHVYVSGSWYSNPHTPSTWNYMSVHVHGTLRFLDGAELERILRQTTLHFEDHDESSPTAFDNLPSSLTSKLMNAIAAFEIEITSMKGVFKLSQDRDAESYRNIIQKLRETDAAGRFIADEMEKRIASLFSRSI